MRFSLCLLFLLGINFITFSQSNTYFIKYKNSVDKSLIEEKISSKKLSESSSLNLLKNNIDFEVEPFAKNLGKNDENLARIIKVTSQQISPLQKSSLNNYFTKLKNSDPDIEYMQEANIYKTDIEFNDSLITQQWALQKIQAFDAWDITQGEDSVILGIIDTGIDYLHPDLNENIFINSGETGIDNFGNDKRFNGIDDDGNGFVDDYMGWDFTDRVGFPFDDTGGDYLTWDNDPYDDNGHGTAIAGIAAAIGNNNIGISGTAPGIKILNLRAFDPGGFGEEDDVAAAILYAVHMGVKIINMSFGDEIFSLVLKDVIKYAYSQNVLLIASSGNTGNNSPHYPSGYSEVLSVGNSTEEDYVASNSSYGSTIDLVAPGSSILTTERNGKYSSVSGTSAAAPFVSGTAALISSLGNFTNEELKQILKSTTDDINSSGWDDRSGTGRLNAFKAISVTAPADIKINFPLQDFASGDDLLNINVSVISPNFVRFNLFLGEELNPSSWVPLISNFNQQISNQNIYQLSLADLPEGPYTLRLAVELSNGNLTEERVNFHIIRSAPDLNLINSGIVFHGDKSTVLAEAETDQISVVRLYYRKKGEGSFNFVTLDGFATNNSFFQNKHYGFIPKNLIASNTTYEVYFEAENLAGIKTTADNNGNFFEYITEPPLKLQNHKVLPFTLPKGNIYINPVNFLSENFNEILFNPFYETDDTIYYSLYQYSNEELENIDSIAARFPRAAGDFNNNGRKDLLGSWERKGYIDEQISPGKFKLENKFKDEQTGFYPLFAGDIDNDDKIEIISNSNNKNYIVWEINSDLSISFIDTLINYSEEDTENNNSSNEVFNNVIAADLNGDGINEIWFSDSDGDILSYNILGGSRFERGESLNNFPNALSGIDNYVIGTGDYDGDGIDDLAVLLESLDIAEYYVLLIFNFKNNQFNLIFQKSFIDQSSEFTGFNFTRFYQSLKFVDIDNDMKDELILNVFPYVYIFKYSDSGSSPIFFSEGINSQYLFSGDLNQNGVEEIALQSPDGYRFYEFGEQIKTSPPSYVKGFSIDSTSIKLEWISDGSKFYIYKGTNKENIILYDSTSDQSYLDISLKENAYYYYKIQAYNILFEEPLSVATDAIEIYTHKPAKIISAESRSSNSILVNFSDRINNTIENLQAFEVPGTGFSNSISAASQNSYLVNFKKDLAPGVNQLIIRDLRDYYGSAIENDTITFNVLPHETLEKFFITSYEILNPFLIKISFNFEVNESSAADLKNYSFEPDNSVNHASLDEKDKKVLYLDLKNGKPVGSIGKEYKLQINGLYSSESTGNIKINSGSGSYIILSSFANDLSDVYVYPNPAKVKGGEGKVTFANLPRKARITIWNLNGIQISSLEEYDGNGGVDFNLRNSYGELLNSGIYLFRIIRLDDAGNEVETKIGKFTVVR